MLSKIIIAYADYQDDQRKTLRPEALALQTAFQDIGDQVELMPLPFLCEPEQFLKQILAYRLMPVAEYADKLICLGNPVQVLRHPQKIVWLDRVDFFQSQDPAYTWLDKSLVEQIQSDASCVLADNEETLMRLGIEGHASTALLESAKILQLVELLSKEDAWQSRLDLLSAECALV